MHSYPLIGHVGESWVAKACCVALFFSLLGFGRFWLMRLFRAKDNETAQYRGKANEAESEKRQVMMFLDAILDSIPVAVFAKDAKERRFVIWNKASEELFGFSKAETINKTDYDLFTREQSDYFREMDNEVFASRAQITIPEEPVDTANNGTRFLYTKKWGIYSEDGEPLYLLGITEDITDRRKTEANLHILSSAIDAAADQIMITDNCGAIEFVNPAFEHETGYLFEEIKGKKPNILRSGRHDDRFYQCIWNTINKGFMWQGEITNCRKDGMEYTEEMSITPVRNKSGDIEHFIAIKRDVTERKSYEAKLDHLAHHDSLTGLPNRLLFNHRLTQSIERARTENFALAVLFIDIDRFKIINDTLGHNIGDSLLRAAAQRIHVVLRNMDILARMGGDEFTVILHGISSEEQARIVAQRILDVFSLPFALSGRELFVSASIGVSIFPQHGSSAELLVKNADTAMYCSKARGGNSMHFYDQALHEMSLDRMNLEGNLHKAMDMELFQVYYQPRVDIASGRIMGAEALLRWNDPNAGFVSPGTFIPVAEETGLIVRLSEWVLREVCRQYARWQDQGYTIPEIAVNISARHFQHANIADLLLSTVEEYSLNPKHIGLEITESTLMQNHESAAATLLDLRDMGVKISLDDFGTGYSSLSYLKKFPIDTVKIDKSFVKDICSSSDDAAIAGAIIAMAHSLNLKVVAEGVETQEQLQFLSSLDCDEMQGYLVSVPLPSDQFEVFCGNMGSDVFASLDISVASL